MTAASDDGKPQEVSAVEVVRRFTDLQMYHRVFGFMLAARVPTVLSIFQELPGCLKLNDGTVGGAAYR